MGLYKQKMGVMISILFNNVWMPHAGVERRWQLKLVIPAEFLNVAEEIISGVNIQKTLLNQTM